MAELDRAETISDAAKMQSFFLKGQHCDVRAIVRSKVALVAFDNLASIDERPENGPWAPWLTARAEGLGYSIIGMQSHAKDWYRTPEPAQQIAGLVEHGFFDQFDRVLFIGTSMGGFAALCFVGLVPGARVAAFSPQSTLNRSITPFERRYPWPFRRFDWESPAFLDASDYLEGVPGGHVFFDPHLRQDKLHAARLITQTIRPVQIPFSDHTLVRTVAKSGALDHLLRRLAEHGTLDTEFWRMMRNRRNDRQWAKQLLAKVEARGDGVLARRACRFLTQGYDYPFARRTKRRLAAATKDQAEALARRRAAQPFWTDDLTEADVRRQIPVFINSFNQLTYLRDTVDWFARYGFENVTVLDNRSDHPELLQYLKSPAFEATARVVHLDETLEPRQALAYAAGHQATDRGFIFTDADLALPDPPAPEMVKTMIEMGLRHDYIKVGLALSLDPEIIDLDRIIQKARTVEQVEAKHWKKQVEPGVYIAKMDRTFFVYVPRVEDGKRFNDYGLRQAKIPSVRIGRKGFVAVYRPWLFRDEIDAAEAQYNSETTNMHSSDVMAQKAVEGR